MNRITTDFFYPFDTIDVARIHSLVLHMIKFGVDTNDVVHMVEEYMDHQQMKQKSAITKEKSHTRRIQAHKDGTRSHGICPLCSSVLFIIRVNHTKSTQIEEKEAAHMFVCKNTDCIYTKPF